jgi:hypothetical protein
MPRRPRLECRSRVALRPIGGSATAPLNLVANVTLARQRVYAVTPGPFTVNLLYAAFNGTGGSLKPSIQTAQLTALFVPS